MTSPSADRLSPRSRPAEATCRLMSRLFERRVFAMILIALALVLGALQTQRAAPAPDGTPAPPMADSSPAALGDVAGLYEQAGSGTAGDGRR